MQQGKDAPEHLTALRRLAVQVALQLPPESADAMSVLDLARDAYLFLGGGSMVQTRSPLRSIEGGATVKPLFADA